MIGVQRVTKSSSIQVYGIDKLKSDHLMLYFEKIGADVADVKLHAEHDCAVVDFTDGNGKNDLHVSVSHVVTHTITHIPVGGLE